jgi:hypothetical protein
MAATAFLHFTDPAGGKIYAQKAVLDDDGKPKLDDDGEPITEDDLAHPLGVNMVAPGSKEARAAEDDVAKFMRKRAEAMTAKQRKEDNNPSTFLLIGTEKAARMVTEFVGFDYQGKTSGVEAVRAFLNDPTWKLFADQIRNATGDNELFMKKASAS